MEALEVCAVMVTFHPAAETLTNIALLMPQVKELVVVDNGSGRAAVVTLRKASREHAFTLIEMESNVGIAAALNVGVKSALARGYRWVIVFDQDSTVTPGFLDAMIAGYRMHPRRDFVGIFCPHYIDRSTGLAVATTKLDSEGNPMVAMTSGSLMPSWIFERSGWFMEELFIDQVDVEYCFRLRASGYTIGRSPEARLLHSAGSPRIHRLWLLGSFRATHHDTHRRYYVTRNRVWVALRYWRPHRDWCTPILRSIVADTVKLILVEDSKIPKLRSTLMGIYDAFKGRLGKIPE